MPCRDWYAPSTSNEGSLKKRNDELAKEACDLRALILEIAARNELSEDIKKRIKPVIKAQRNHRECDREDAISNTRKSIDKVKRDISAIKKLGGNPGKKLTKKLEELNEDIIDIMNSDPLNTDLY